MTSPAPSFKVCRFRRGAAPDDPDYTDLPEDGLCLNVFLLLRERDASRSVLMGRVDPGAPWDRLGGISAERVRALGARWMLPSRQLRLYEAPAEAARTVAAEQLDLPAATFERPSILSDAWERPQGGSAGLHWDLSFLYPGRWPEGRPPAARPWRELRFLDPSTLDPSEVGRHHLDVLEGAGYTVRPGAP